VVKQQDPAAQSNGFVAMYWEMQLPTYQPTNQPTNQNEVSAILLQSQLSPDVERTIQHQWQLTFQETEAEVRYHTLFK
jgi:hypothetical protein